MQFAKTKNCVGLLVFFWILFAMVEIKNNIATLQNNIIYLFIDFVFYLFLNYISCIIRDTVNIG